MLEFQDVERTYPLVVITGRTNVGKSTLFNRLSQARIAIVDPSPGVTRDFLENFVTIGKTTVRLVDTGGLEIFFSADNDIQRAIESRVWSMLQKAHLVLFVVDGRNPLTQIEWELMVRLRRANLSVLLVVNKREGMTSDPLPEEFLRLGFDNIVQISAQHGDGMAMLRKRIEQELQDHVTGKVDPAQHAIQVAIVGKPNVGKSTLYNTILGEERAIVSHIPGTTRDALLTVLRSEYGKYALLDTAGLTRGSKTEKGVNFYAFLRTTESIEKAQICILVLDPFQGITRQDQRIAQEIWERKKCCLVFLNKMDLLPRNTRITPEKLLVSVRTELNFLNYAVFLAGSAQEATLRGRILPILAGIFTRYHQVINRDLLNGAFRDMLNRRLEGIFSERTPLVRRIAQESVAPPVLLAYTHHIDEKKTVYYARVLEKILREEMNWEGVPIEIRVERA